MAKQLNTVNLTFNADTGKARQQLQELQTMLDKLVKGSIASSSKSQLPLTKELTEAQVAASKLQTILKQTTNANTGNLDLTKFSESINRSGLSLNKLQTQLNSLGADGQKAFISLASSIVSADVPLTRTSKLATELWTTLKNTARWQLSSSVLHGFMGTIQSAYGYAQDLNESLNNIRIVTGQNTEQMARFAEQANRVAKELSATTTDYTNASLIYYQQGLDDNQVAERTNVTIKMANAAGESAQKVSDQLTAVWNNFYEEGGKSLEYYADVMTALGAATASSTDEISEGLNKFASVAETVGLSYEYAASALATVTATTRQSADVVGTAFKTLFARIQDLELGETLEDGTTLGQYSEALNKVGVNIKDANGGIKEMDIILEEMAAKWDTLAKDQQISLAQSVAGVRQYTQLIALMDNWDFMKENLQVTADAEGTLNEQAEIYAESWEAAKDRVRAAAEDIYDSLLDEDFFIRLLDGFEMVLTGVGNLVDAVGGLPGILSIVGAVMTRVFSQQMAQAINNMVFGMKSLSGETRKTAEQMKQDAVNLATNMSFNTGTEAGDREGQALKDRLLLTQQIQNVSENLTQEEREQLTGLLEINDAYAQQAIEAAKVLDKEREKVQNQSGDIRKNVLRSKGTSNEVRMKDYQMAQQIMENFAKKTVNAKESLDKLNAELADGQADKFNNSINSVIKHLNMLGQSGLAKGVENIWKRFKDNKLSAEEFKAELAKLVTAENLVSDSTVKMADDFHRVVGKAGVTINACDNMAEGMIKVATATKVSDAAYQAYQNSLTNLQNSVKGFNTVFNDFGQNVIKISQGISSLLMGFNSLKGAFDALKNPDLSFGEKTLQVFQSLTMAIPSLIMGYNALTTVKWASVAAQWAEVKAAGAKVIADTAGVVATWLNVAADKTHTTVIWNKIKSYFALNAIKSKTLALSLKLALVLVAVVAVIAAVVKIIDVLSDAYNKDALAAERAQEAAQNLATEYNNTKQAYEDMVAAMDNYKSATDALATMTKGTEEYRDALKEANEAALELISAGNLTKDDYDWEDGQLKIDEAALTRVKEEQANEVSKAYATSQMANVRASQAQNQADFTDLKRDMSAESVSKYGQMGLTTSETEKGIQKALDYMAENGTGVLDDTDLIKNELEINDSRLIEALYTNRSAIEELSGSIESASALEEASQQQIANELMADKGYENTESGRKALEAGGRVYGAEEQASYDKWMKTNLADFDIGTAAGKNMWKEYAKEAGLYDLKGLKLDYEDDRVKYEYIDDEGNPQEKEVTKEEMAQVLAAAEAAEQLGASMEVLKNKIGQLTSSAEIADKALAEFLTDGNLEGTTKAEYDAAKEQVTTDGQIDDVKVDSYLGLTGDTQADLELAKSYGYESAEAYKEAFVNSLNLEWNIPAEIGKDVADKLTANAADKITQNMTDLGTEGGKAYVQMMNDAMEGIDWDKLTPEEAKEATEALANVDLSAWDAADQIVDIVHQYGGEVASATEEWKKNEAAIRSAAGAVFDIDSWQSSTSEKQSIVSGLKIGDTIDAEEYNKLGDIYSQFFELQNDGTYKLIAAAKDLQNAIQAIETRKMLDNILNENKNIQTVQSDSGLNIDSAQNLMNKYAKNEATDKEIASLEAYKAKVEEVYDIECASIQDAINIMQQHDQQLSESQGALFNSATSLQELKSLREQVGLETGNVDYNQYAEALMTLAAQYDNCTQEIEEYRQALISANAEQVAVAEDALNAAVLIGEASTKYGLDSEVLETQAKQIKKLNPELNLTAEQAARLAVNNQRLNKGIKTLNDNFKDWKKTLKTADKASMDYAEAMTEVESAIGDMLGAADDFTLPDGFLDLEENLNLIEKAAKGDEIAINTLGTKISYASVEALTFNEAIANAYNEMSGANIDMASFETARQTVLNGITDIENNLSGLLDGSKNITDVLGNDWVAALNQMAIATGMSVEDMNGLLSQLGVTADVKTQNVKQEVEVPTYDETWVPAGQKTFTYTEIGENGEETSHTITRPVIRKMSVPGPIVKTEGYVQVASIGTVEGGGADSANISYTGVGGTANNKSGGNIGGGVSPNSTKGKGGGGGGSKSKPTKVEKTKKSDVVERYKEVEDKIDDVRDAMEDASRAADRLYGNNRIKQMKEVSKQLDKEVKLLRQKKEESEEYLKTDKTALKNAAKDAGITFTFDNEGNIKNYEDEMTKLYNRLAAAEKKADPSNFKTKEKQDAYIEKNVTPLKEKIEALKEAIDQYDETRELIEDLDDEAQEKFNEWQDNNFEILNYELELKLEVDDAELRKLEYLLSKIEDDFYSMAEAGALMIGKATKDTENNVTGLNTGGQLGVYLDRFKDLEDQRDALKESFQQGKISEAAYIEGLQNLEDQAYDNAEAIQDLDNTMMHYYGDTLEAAQEELSKYTDMMDQHVEVLEHYANVMDIIGKSTDYESMGEILEAQAEVAENNLAVSKANYQMLDEQRDQRKAEYEAAIGNATDEELAVLKQKWLDAEAAANNAQDEMMADAEAWAEALRAVVENKLAGLAQSLEKALTADFGGSFDQMSAQMERARDLQEEYLTDTNKIYETNKLINKAQQDIDKTTNTVAKKRLQNYIKETEQLQNKAKLSNYELEIQQAKYDLVLAEIALEEAQNAKSTVRLQRDAEGNFGYVYTADSSKVAEAEQQLADAQNRLYNIGLEGANDYTEKYQQILAEMYDTLTELQTQYLEGAFASEEEYNTAVANAKEYYYAKLAQYSDLYTIALTTDSAVRVDAWSTDFDDMIYSTDKWQQSVNEYLGNVQSVFAEWETQVAKIREETVGKDLDALKQKTKDIKDESKKLKDQIADPKDGVIKAIKDEIEEVNKLTNAYAKARKQIQGTQTDHENFIKELRESIENPDKDKKKEDPVIPKKEEEPKKEDPQPTTPKTDAIDYDKIKKGTKVEVKSGQKWYYDSYGISPTGTARDGTIKYINRDGTHPFNIEGLGWIKQSAIKKVVKYDTGGYTGSWGPQGKLAMLHEKELILNKHDTENFLASMDVLDRILQAIDLRAMSSQLGGILTSPTFGGQMKEEHLEQNVTIEANFPGVSMASEIEEAFENIVNLASQYANRK